MATLKYFLKEPNAKTETLVYLVFQYGYFETDPKTGRKKYKQLKLSTGEKIHPKFWNIEKSRARENKGFPEHAELNTRLDNLESVSKTVFRRLDNEGIFPSPSLLKSEILKELKGPKKKTSRRKSSLSFFEFIDQIIQESKDGSRLTTTGNKYAKGTITGYIKSRNWLYEFQKSRKSRITFDSINRDFYNKYVNFLYKSGLSKNTVGGYIKNLKVFLNEAFDRGITTKMEFKKKWFRVLQEETEATYLSKEELDKIIELDLSENPRMDLVRDNFVLDCLIGLRIADYNNLRKDHIADIKGVKMIKIRMQKTGNIVVIPLNHTALTILEKHDYELKTYSGAHMNRELKKLGELAGINEKFKKSITRNGERQEETKEKYYYITNHTARRSFATNLYLADVPTLDIMQMTGHKTERAFLSYIRVTPEQNAIRVSKKHDFFALKE